jgi:hypothetical protein
MHIKIDDTTLGITFEPIEATDEKDIYDVVSADGKNGKKTGLCRQS